MRKVIMYCDRCKKEFEKWNHKRKELIGVGEIIHEDGDQYLDSQKDLCESCYVELENWWNFNSKAEVKIKNKIYMRGYEDGKSDVLDKMRAEIDKLSRHFYSLNPQYLLDMIDKYKAESEE